MSDEMIIHEKKDGVATLTFNRPQAMNAGNFQMVLESRRAIDDAGDGTKEVFLGESHEKRRTAGKVARIRSAGGSSGVPQIFKPTNVAERCGGRLRDGHSALLRYQDRIGERQVWLFLRTSRSDGYRNRAADAGAQCRPLTSHGDDALR